MEINVPENRIYIKSKQIPVVRGPISPTPNTSFIFIHDLDGYEVSAMSKKGSLSFPLITIFIFATLIGALLYRQEALPAGQQLPVALGLLAFSLALTEVFIALRPKCLERRIGLPLMYSIHGSMAIVLILVAIAHIGSELIAWKDFAVTTATLPAGVMAMIFLVFTVLTGIFILSNTFVRKSLTLKRLKETVFKREPGLWVHRLSVLAVLAIFAHMMSVGFVRSDIVFGVLSGLYVLLAVGGYAASKVLKELLPKYILRQCTEKNPGVFELEFAPQKGSPMAYEAGQYVFVRFVKSALPKESHPFSITTAPIKGSASVSVMVKNSGDYTSLLGRLQSGDIATLEGPYGSFMDRNTALADTPLVMLAGGIGITPILSILRSQMEMRPSRTMVLAWGLATQKDLLLLDELQEMAQKNPNFSYHITFSRDHVEPFDFGQISQDYLQRIGVAGLYPVADFFICGPAPMMASMKGILNDNKVVLDKIHIEEFSF